MPAGLERAAEFSWDRSARLTDAAIAQVLAEDAPLQLRSPAPGIRPGRAPVSRSRRSS